uniref:Uncharacterized protein AlNc14C86G5503 n=1 Tax=Albugo laibachii Nc14 TaxID=890382 RepID=F0WFW8_9STRA|nr:conserved hypothetical protein [Albugo laibachii Nc14]|eukprot:CCA20102.1 conserved hypothetical protein [Albugo laibachii Nc14]
MQGKAHSLRFFINRAAALKQFRDFQRVTAALPTSTRSDIRRQIRTEFEKCRFVEDDEQVQSLLRYGMEQLKHVSSLVHTAVPKQHPYKTTNVSQMHPSGQHDDRVKSSWPWNRT